MSYYECETTHASHMNVHPWMYQIGSTPLLDAAYYGHLRIIMVEYLVENGADMEAKNKVSDVILLMWNHTYVTHEYMYLWMYQNGWTPLIVAARNGDLPVVEYLVENGADMEAKNNVNDVISSVWDHSYVTHEYMYLWMKQGGWTPLILAASNGHLAVVEYLVENGADMEAKNDVVSDVILLMWNHTYVTHEWIRVDPLHWYMLQGKVIYQRLNICWRKELIWRQRIE